MNIASAATEIRFARATGRLDEVVAFYRNAVGLEVIDGFTDHDSYSGVMLGLPGTGLHLEITARSGHPIDVGRSATRENLLVFYLPGTEEFAAARDRIVAAGHAPVAAENPYWAEVGAITFADPDGWRIVLVPRSYAS